MVEINRLVLRAPAKINWLLQVCGRQDDGYHQLHSLMQSISLCDRVSLTIAEADSCSCPGLNCPAEKNLALRVWLALKRHCGISQSLAIEITKNIPDGGGLGGGSADAAAVLLGAKQLFNIDITLEQLCELAFPLGADIPFCLHGGLAEIVGAGETVIPQPIDKTYELLLVSPRLSLSTASVFQNYDALPPRAPRINPPELLAALRSGQPRLIVDKLENMLEPAAIVLCPHIAEIKNILADLGFSALMSGSGSCVFALCTGDEAQDAAALTALRQRGFFAEKLTTLTQGVKIVSEA